MQKKIKKKGFTLVELLIAIVIIALLSGMGIISYRSVFSTAEERYYNAIESNLLLAGNDYFEDHRDILPAGSEYSSVSLADLIENKYIEEIVDTEGNLCSEGTVYAYRENNKFKYEVCLDCGGYKSDGKYCNGPASRRINVSAKKAISNESYLDIEKSYNKAGYSNGENIIATFSMNSEYNVKQYRVTNTRGASDPLSCNVVSGTSCSVELEKSGTYRVIALDEENKEISSKYINAKIAKGQANFVLDMSDKYLITKNECNKNKISKKITINIVKQTNEEYESIKYQIYTDPLNKGDFKEPRGLRIEEELESGHYTIDVIVKNYSDEEEKMVSKTFDISYLVDIEYEDDHTTATHEVVKGQTYNYLDSLPETKLSSGQNLEVRWYKDNSQINPNVDLVTENCTHQLTGKTSIPVNVEDFTTYCNKDTGVNGLKYTGSELTLTNTPPANVTFTNNKGTAVNTYSVKAHINAPLYIWSDGTTADKTFNCSIVKGDNPMTVTDNQTWNVSYSPNNQTKTITGASSAAGTVTYTISSQPSGNKFSLSGTTLTMAGGTGTGTHTIVINAHADGNGSYNSVDKTFNVVVSVGVVPNRMTVTTPQTWNPTYGTSAQDKAFTGASSADGAVTYSIPSDKNNATIRGYFSIPTASTASLRMAANTPSGTYAVVVRAHAAGSGGYEAGDKDITINVTVGAQACNKPTGLSIGTNGVITWTASSNCGSAQHQIKIGSGSYENASSGVNKYAALTASTGTKTVCVKTIKPNNSFSDSAELCVDKNVYSVTLSKGTGISAVTGSGKNHIAGETVSIDATASSGYTWSKWTQTSGGSQVSTTKAYSGTISSNWAYTANATANTYTLNYSDNLFAARTQNTSGVLATYTENGSYLTLNGTLNTTGISELWNLERRTINSGDIYKITLNYISGSLTCADSSACTGSAGRPVFVLDLTTNGSTFSDRITAPNSCVTINLPTSGTSEGSLTVASSRASANGLKYWIWQKTANNAVFNNYKVQIIITKVHSKSTTYNAQYGTLDTPTKTGYTFNGWYTAASGGTKVTNTSTYTTAGNQTLYAQWTSHKLIIQYNGNGSDVTWCSTNSSYSMDSEKYEVKSSSRNAQYIGYGQFVSYSAGLDNYDNTSYTCFARSGKKAVSGAEWILNGKSNTYGHNDTSVNAIGIASNAGCNLATTASCTARLNVNWAGDAVITCTSPQYSGSSQTIATCSGGTLSNHTRTAVGSQTVTCTGDGSHNTVTKSCSIVQHSTTMSISASSGTLTYGTNGSVTVTTNSDGAISCTTSDSAVATCSVSGKTVTITPKANTADNKTATITIKQAASTNYVAAANKTYTATVNRKTISCPGSPANKKYSGSSQASGISCPGGSTAGGTQSATNTGSYSQSCSANSGYKFASTCSVAWKIVQNCSAGTYLKANTQTCTTCPSGSYCGGGSNLISSSSDQGRTGCPSGYGNSDGARTAASNCYYTSSENRCVGHSRLNECDNTTPYVTAQWYEADWIPDYYNRNQTVHEWKCLESYSVCKNGSNLTNTGYCYQYSHSNCYNWDYTWALAPNGGKTATQTHCDCRRVVALTSVSCKVYYGTSSCV